MGLASKLAQAGAFANSATNALQGGTHGAGAEASSSLLPIYSALHRISKAPAARLWVRGSLTSQS